MKCFYHTDVDAIAICKNCSKGLCQECAADLGNGVACRDKCEIEVETLNKVIQQSKTAYQKTSTAYMQYAVWLALVGVAFVIAAVAKTQLAWFLAPLGLLLVVGGLFSYWSGRKFAS